VAFFLPPTVKLLTHSGKQKLASVLLIPVHRIGINRVSDAIYLQE
jgi:hypothetical protein